MQEKGTCSFLINHKEQRGKTWISKKLFCFVFSPSLIDETSHFLEVAVLRH